jgi:hypothetical protein
MEETSNACRLDMTSTNMLGETPQFKYNFNKSNDCASCNEGENLTDRDAGTDGGYSHILSHTPPPLPHDPVFGYRIHNSMSSIVGKDVFDVSELGSISKFVSSHIEWGLEPGSFLVTNLSVIVNQYVQWKKELPMVFYIFVLVCKE